MGQSAAAKRSAAALAGSRLVGRYQLDALVGKGGMAYVYRAEDTLLGRQVAIKVLSEKAATDTVTMQRFVREARAMAALDSTHIVPLYDVGNDGPHTFLVMKFMDAPSLDKLIAREGRLDAGAAAHYLSQVLSGLTDLHQTGVVHRDVKPGNILVDDSGFTMLLDLGIALNPSMAGLTADGIILGTPAYISPEQVAGRPIDARSDLYAAGVVLFEVLTGRLPFTARKQVDVCLAHLREPPPSPREIVPEVPEAMARIVLRALEKEPERRFQTAAQFRSALEQLGDLTTRGPMGRGPAITPPAARVDPASRTTDALARGDVAAQISNETPRNPVRTTHVRSVWRDTLTHLPRPWMVGIGLLFMIGLAVALLVALGGG